MECEKLLEIIGKTEYRCGELMLSAGNVCGEQKSGRRDVVTEYDSRIQKILVDELGGAVPGAHFFCEERGNRDSLGAEHVFVIDPIDGTMNFVHGFNYSCIAVAYLNRGKPAVSAVYNPYADEMFSAIAGKGAYLNGKRLGHVPEEPLENCIICCGTSPYYPEKYDETFSIMRKCMEYGLDIRRQGTAELDFCSVAAGRAGLFFEQLLSFWDFAAGMLIAGEAGALCLAMDGNGLPLDGRKSSVLCGNSRAVEDFLKIL